MPSFHDADKLVCARSCRCAACHACYFSHIMLPGGSIRSGTSFQRLRMAYGCIMSARPLLSPAHHTPRCRTCGSPRACQRATLPRRGRKWAAPVVAAARFGGVCGSQAAGLQVKARTRLAAQATPCQRRPLELGSVEAGAPAVANRKRESTEAGPPLCLPLLVFNLGERIWVGQLCWGLGGAQVGCAAATIGSYAH